MKTLLAAVLATILVGLGAHGQQGDSGGKLRKLRAGAESADATAQWLLGNRYAKGEGVAKDEVEAVKWYRKAAEQNHPMAQYSLGECYEEGKGVTQDESEAVKWYRKATELNCEMAFVKLADCYDEGKGVTQNEAEAVKWYLRAADAKIPGVEIILALHYEAGMGVATNYVEAYKWYLLGVRGLDVPFGREKLALLEKKMTPEQMTQAKALARDFDRREASWLLEFRRAAEGGNQQAQVELGECYRAGVGVGKDEAVALKWYRKAAEQRFPDVLYVLGCWYENGIGTMPDYAEAYTWYLRSVALIGDESGKEAARELEAKLTPEQINQAQKRAREFTPAAVAATEKGVPDKAAKGRAHWNYPTNASKTSPWTNSLGMVFVPVPDTKVLMCIWETRVQDYQSFVHATGQKPEAGRFEQIRDHPAVGLSWGGAKMFCTWLTTKEAAEGRINRWCRYRLPTDAEWSCAVGLGALENGKTPAEKNGVVEGSYPWGHQWPPPQGAGNYDPELRIDPFPYTAPVGSFSPNALGLYDLGGNALEWCEDVFERRSGSRVLRGGGWNSPVHRAMLNSSIRFNATPWECGANEGFRVVLVVTPVSR